MSRFGHWVDGPGVAGFAYTADQRTDDAAEWDPLTAPPTRRHWHMIGNRRLQVQVANDGTAAVWDAADGHRWLTAPDPAGTGVSVLVVDDGSPFGTAVDDWPAGPAPVRTFGPTSFTVETSQDGVALERMLLCPEGEDPFLFVRVRLRALDTAHRVRLREKWQLRPRFVTVGQGPDGRRTVAERVVRHEVVTGPGRILARQQWTGEAEPGAGTEDLVAAAFGVFGGTPTGKLGEQMFGVPRTVALVDPSGRSEAVVSAGQHPELELVTELELVPGLPVDVWFRFGLATEDDLASATPAPDSYALAAALSNVRLGQRLPAATSTRLPEASRELPWHAAILTGGACRDEVLGGHTLDQGSAYAFEIGINGAARDPLQHALPLVYLEPDLALSVLRNTCAWATPDGDLPYALDGGKRPFTDLFTPSDQNIYALWLATEYLAATGDVTAFDVPVPYHPDYGAEPVPLRDHLVRQQQFLLVGVGLGERGHLRIRNADWNDSAINEAGIPRDLMIAKGESVLNSAFASWVLARWATACERIGAPGAATARQAAVQLREAVSDAWNGRWFQRAFAPGAPPVGDDECWLEVQPWAILCGAAGPDRAEALLRTIDAAGRRDSPLGARLRFGAPPANSLPANSDVASVWFAVNATLVWAASSVDPELATDEWRRMTLANHVCHYPSVWEGTLSGPDAYNGPESSRPGRTWSFPSAGIGMQAYPVANLHSHAQPLLAYLRLLGVEPRPDGGLAVGGPASAGSSIRTPTLRIDADGHGRLVTAGQVAVHAASGVVRGSGEVAW